MNNELQVLRKTINTRTNSDPTTSESTLPLPKHHEMNKHQKTTKRHLNEEMNSTNIPQQLNLKVDDGPGHVNDSTHQHHSKETFALYNATTENYYTIPTSNSFALLTNVKDQLDGEYTQVPKQGDISLKTYPTSHKSRESTNISVQEKLQDSQQQKVFNIPTLTNGTVKNSSVKVNKLPQNTVKSIHKMVLIGDSHIRGFASSLRSVLPSKVEIFSMIKPGSHTKALRTSITETINQLTQDDVIVLSSGTNDYDQDNFKSTYGNIKECLLSVTHTNVLVLRIPFRYDLRNSREVNYNIAEVNKKIFKLTKILPNAKFLAPNNDGNLFTKHGLHRNSQGKQIIVTQIVMNITFIFSLYKHRDLKGIPLLWHNVTENPQEPDGEKVIKRNSNRLRKTPVTKNSGFFW